MSSELDAFETNIAQAQTMVGTAEALASQVTSVIDTSDLLRAALVQGVSALDHFVHELVRVEMVRISKLSTDKWPAGFSRFKISMASVAKIQAGNGPDAWLSDEVRAQHGYLAFQQPDKIADAIRIVCDQALWGEVAKLMQSDAATVKTRLKIIVDRRNKIAHEADYDPTPPQSRYSISAADAHQALDFLREIGRAIEAVVRPITRT